MLEIVPEIFPAMLQFWLGRAMMQGNDDDILTFTPESGFVIEKLASDIVQMMKNLDMDAHIQLPDGTVIEVERDCSKQDIISGYKAYLAGRTSSPSNKNDRPD